MSSYPELELELELEHRASVGTVGLIAVPPHTTEEAGVPQVWMSPMGVRLPWPRWVEFRRFLGNTRNDPKKRFLLLYLLRTRCISATEMGGLNSLMSRPKLDTLYH